MRNQSILWPLPVEAPKTIFFPSGEIAGGAPSRKNSNVPLSGGRIDVRTGG